jgi:CRP/FNR family transcriptional activator FtrB
MQQKPGPARAGGYELLRTLSLFKAASPDSLTRLMDAASLQRFPQGTTIIREGEHPRFLYVIVEGAVELGARHGRRETAIDILQPITAFVLAAVIRGDAYLNSARTLGPSQILMIPADVVREIYANDAGVARAVGSALAEQYCYVVRSLKNEKLRTSAERLANWIVWQDRQQGGRGLVALAIDKRTLAMRLGMTPENLSRSLGHLAEHGVRNLGSSFAIDDRAALTRFANPNPLIDD